jgi:hypothetical protein
MVGFFLRAGSNLPESKFIWQSRLIAQTIQTDACLLPTAANFRPTIAAGRPSVPTRGMSVSATFTPFRNDCSDRGCIPFDAWQPICEKGLREQTPAAWPHDALPNKARQPFGRMVLGIDVRFLHNSRTA